jgi:Putative Ig domain
LIFRLVNDDSDTTTSVRFTDLVLSGTGVAIDGAAPAPDTARPPVAPVPPAFFNTATDVSPSIGADYHRTSFNPNTKELYANVALVNQGTYGLNGAMVVVIKNISDPTVELRNADGYTPDGLAYYTFTSTDGNLDPTEVSAERTLVFKNPNGVQFTYEVMVLADLNSAPVISSQPEIVVLRGQTYQYQMAATDRNGDPLTYRLLSGPTGMAINANTGLVSWTPGASGNYQILVEVNDGRGGIAQQDFNLAVISNAPNRPPLFTSNPGVDAQINVGYRYDADASDPDRDTLLYSLINGPDGMKVNPLTGEVTWTPPATMIYGDTVISNIRNAGERDSFTFSGHPGQRIYFDPLKYTGAVTDWAVKIYDPNGVLVASGDFNYEAPLALTQTGNYKVVIETNGDKVGSYAFSLIDLDRVPNIELDKLVAGTLVPGSESDLFKFSGQAGQNLYFDKLSSTTTLDWVLYNSRNEVVWQSNWQDKEFALPHTGDYLLVLKGKAGFSNTVGYEFEIITPDVITTNLTLNQPISGTIVEKGEQRVYTFTGSAGQQLFYDALTVAANSSFRFKLIDPTGKIVFDNDAKADFDPSNGLVLKANGLYQVVIDGAGESTGNYQFQLLNRADAQEINLDEDITGQLQLTNSSTGYRFSLASDRYIYFNAQAGSGSI